MGYTYPWTVLAPFEAPAANAGVGGSRADPSIARIRTPFAKCVRAFFIVYSFFLFFYFQGFSGNPKFHKTLFNDYERLWIRPASLMSQQYHWSPKKVNNRYK